PRPPKTNRTHETENKPLGAPDSPLRRPRVGRRSLRVRRAADRHRGNACRESATDARRADRREAGSARGRAARRESSADADTHPGVQKLAPAPARPRVEAADALLVVIHGYKDTGWRNPEAMQTYLLKNAAGADMSAQPRADAQTSSQKKTPRLLGDVIRERL